MLLSPSSFGVSKIKVREDSEDPKFVEQFLEKLLCDALDKNASDVHIEPFSRLVKVRYRIDGFLFTSDSFSRSLHQSLILRLKVLSGLNITETRIAQDGRFSFNFSGRVCDVRISILPSLFGESVVVRFLSRKDNVLALEELGFSREELNFLLATLEERAGLLVFSGPTGSGKTSSVYSLLEAINVRKQKIISIEDPVERIVSGITQVQVKEQSGLTFPAMIRSVLRQSPDMILIGEIRDSETAEMAVRAGLSGHMVLTTLHASGALGVVPRLEYLGVSRDLLGASLKLLVGQRLVRRVCSNCASSYVPEDRLLSLYGITKELLAKSRIQKGVGCHTCLKSGFNGRVGVFEICKITKNLYELIYNSSSSLDLSSKMMASGMKTLAEDGKEKALKGLTTLEEVACHC